MQKSYVVRGNHQQKYQSYVVEYQKQAAGWK